MSSDKDLFAQRIAQYMNSQEGTSPAWGLNYESGGEGWARASMVIKKNMLNGHGFAHGGIIFSLADTAFAYACNSRNAVTVAQQASITFLSWGRLGETLVAEAREEAVAGRSGVYNVIITGDGGRKVAIFQGLSRSIRGKIIDEDT